MSFCTRWLPKRGHTEEEYEDAFWPVRTIDGHAGAFRCALADGASETSFSGRWAALLAAGWCRSRSRQRWWDGQLPRLQERWRGEVGHRPLPWYAEEKYRAGAFSSLLGLQVVDASLRSGDRRWSAVAVGDTCLFQLRAGRVLRAFPYDSADEFTNRPVLISTDQVRNRAAREAERHTEGDWQPGDVFYLMTDALAQWFLEAIERGQAVEVAMAGDQKFFLTWIDGLRNELCLRNDDVTIVRLAVL